MTTVLVLTCTYYFGDFRFLVSILQDVGLDGLALNLHRAMTIHPDADLYRAFYWASVVIFFYSILPAICIKWIFKDKFSDYGTSFAGAFKYYRLYLGMLVVMVPLVIYFSATDSFLRMYPFYKVSPGDSLFPKFFIWEIFYFMQFVALEFFFRGFILHGTKHRFGFYAIFFMMVPYCMIHFGKPMPETIAAIIAGVVLGYMSLMSRNIWMGVFVHCSVAFMMDISALIRQGVFGGLGAHASISIATTLQ
nr:CPBP family intramembrane glutamic endopeptidase [Nitrosomonas sp. Nm51]